MKCIFLFCICIFQINFLYFACWNIHFDFSWFYQFFINKVKGWISKRVFQENKAHQISWKMNISYPLVCTRICAYQGVRSNCFSENLTCFVFVKHPFWDSPFFLITNKLFIGFHQPPFFINLLYCFSHPMNTMKVSRKIQKVWIRNRGWSRTIWQ